MVPRSEFDVFVNNCPFCRQWHAEKLSLPHCLKIPKDFFYTYTYEPSHNVFEPPNQSQKADGMPEQNDENNFNNNDDFVSISFFYSHIFGKKIPAYE